MSVRLFKPHIESSSEQLENASMTQASHDRNQLDSIVQLVTCDLWKWWAVYKNEQ